MDNKRIGFVMLDCGKLEQVIYDFNDSESNIDKRFMVARERMRRIGLDLTASRMSTIGRGKKTSKKSCYL